MADIPGFQDFSGFTLDAGGNLVIGVPTFTVFADLSRPVTLPPGVAYIGPAPVYGVDYGPGIGGTPAGGPEERGPPVDFDTPPALPPPSVAPPIQPPSAAPPEPPSGAPPEPEPFRPTGPPASGGESPESTRGRVERAISDTQVRRDAPQPPPPYIEGEYGPAPKLPPPWWAGPLGGLGRVILGPLGGMIGPVIQAGMPEVLGSGELPFPPIPRVSIPEPPPITLPEPGSPPTPAPAIPDFQLPAPPDVVVVTPSGELPRVSSPPIPAPSSSSGPGLAGIVGAILGAILLPRIGRMPSPVFVSQPAPITNTLAPPAPAVETLSPPAGEFLPGTTPTLGTLTEPQPLVADSGAPQITDPTRTSECNCDQPGQRKKRSKQRKCLTRAPLIWAGGPKKGKAAGTRCIKFEDVLP